MTARISALFRPWYVPSARAVLAMSDEQLAGLWNVTRRSRVRTVILAEMNRRDQVIQDARRAEERRERARERRASERAEYDLFVHGEWLAAEKACNGFLLSEAGREAGIDPVKLWPMRGDLAERYASEELRDWWQAHPRIGYARWRRMAREQRPEERTAGVPA